MATYWVFHYHHPQSDLCIGPVTALSLFITSGLSRLGRGSPLAKLEVVSLGREDKEQYVMHSAREFWLRLRQCLSGDTGFLAVVSRHGGVVSEAWCWHDCHLDCYLH